MSISLPCAAVVDVTAVSSAPPRVLAAFDALGPGEALLLRTVARPAAALGALRDARSGAYEWIPVLEGPGHWEVEVHKRDAAPGTLRRITEALRWDDERLEGIEQAAEAAWDAGDARLGRRLHLRYVAGLLRHIRYEETVLFPEYERVAPPGVGRPATAVMRGEHRAAEALLGEIMDAAANGVRPDERARGDLRALLHEHTLKEESIVYVALERAVGARETDDAVFRFQAMDPA